MGTSPNPGVSGARCTMRAFVIVLLAAVAVNADAEAEAYTVGQVAAGLTNGGIVTGVDHGHGVVSGYGAIGNRAISHVAGVYNALPVNTVYNTVPVHNVAGVYNTPAVYPNVYTGLNHLYGKREAEPEAEAEPFHHTGLGHVAGVYNSYPVSTLLELPTLYPLSTTLLYPLSMLESTTPTTPSPPLLSVVLEFLLCTPTFTLALTTCTASVRLRLSLTSTPTSTTTLESATSDTTTLLYLESMERTT